MKDKIRDEFEKWNTLKYGDYISGTTWSWEAMIKSFEAGYKSRDPEVRYLKEILRKAYNLLNYEYRNSDGVPCFFADEYEIIKKKVKEIDNK